MNTTWAMNALRLQKDNTKLAGLLEEALDCIDQYDYEEAFDLVQRIKDALNHSRMSHPPVVPWGGSSLTEMEELLQKVQQLEHENAALRSVLDETPTRDELDRYHAEKWTAIAELSKRVNQLEAENSEMRADNLEQCMVNAKGSEREYSLRGRIEQLETENAALREDKARLDWLEAGGEPETYDDAPLWWSVFGETGQRSLRAAIDTVRKEGQS